MKKIVLSIAFLIAVSVSANAQFILGVKGGVNFSKLNNSNLTESTVTGYQAGIFMRAGGGLYLQPELYVSSTGGKFTYQNNNSNVTEEGHVKFTNFNIPVLIGERFGSRSLNFRVMAGPVYTSILKKDESFSNYATTTYHDIGNYKKGTLGFQAGAGVDLGAITADVRYEGGLTKINSDFGQRQSLWALSVGFKLL